MARAEDLEVTVRFYELLNFILRRCGSELLRSVFKIACPVRQFRFRLLGNYRRYKPASCRRRTELDESSLVHERIKYTAALTRVSTVITVLCERHIVMPAPPNICCELSPLSFGLHLGLHRGRGHSSSPHLV